MKNLFIIALTSLILLSCQQTAQAPAESPDEVNVVSTEKEEIPKDFTAYWYNGKAELNSYELEQVRYGDIHQGHAVLVFVTEDFSKSQQVKMDFPQGKESDKVSILKLNDSRKFLTGIYPYSIMRSVFTPVDLAKYPQTLKLTTSVQEWCGHVYSQLNWDKDAYKMQLHSYFQSEGDQTKRIPGALLEDEIWTKLRIDPKSIPLGKVEVIPSNIAMRLLHQPIQPEHAVISVEKAAGEFDGEEVEKLIIQYSESRRSLHIYYRMAFPFQILGWDESQPTPVWQKDAPLKTSKARLKKSIRLDYWNHNANSDRVMRDELGL
jgi:hypothetical protein